MRKKTERTKVRGGYGKTEFGHDAAIVCKFGSFPAICLREEEIFVKSQKCPYHVTFDLEHILHDCGVQVWSRSTYLSVRRSDLRKMFIDGWTDGRLMPHDCISSLH